MQDPEIDKSLAIALREAQLDNLMIDCKLLATVLELRHQSTDKVQWQEFIDKWQTKVHMEIHELFVKPKQTT